MQRKRGNCEGGELICLRLIWNLFLNAIQLMQNFAVTQTPISHTPKNARRESQKKKMG